MKRFNTTMMRTLAALLLLVLIISLIAACGSKQGGESGFSIRYAGKDITPDMEMAEVLSAVKENYSVSESSACPPFSGKEKLYVFEHIRIQTYEQNGKDLVMGIFLRDDSISIQGITIGASVADMQTAFGTDCEQAGGTLYIYTAANGSKLKFVVKDGLVASIQLLTKLSDS